MLVHFTSDLKEVLLDGLTIVLGRLAHDETETSKQYVSELKTRVGLFPMP